MAKSTKLTNPQKLGLHLAGGAGDEMLTSALYVFDETKGQSVQDTLDNIPSTDGLLSKEEAAETYQVKGDYVKTVNNTAPVDGNVTIEIPSTEGLLSEETAAATYQVKGNYAKSVNNATPDENGNITVDIPTDYVKTVNGNTPDASGNVVITIPTDYVKKVAGIDPSDDGNVDLSSTYYTKTEVDTLVSGKISFEVVESLPTENIKTNVIYLVPDPSATTDNVYIEYVYASGKWEIIGKTGVQGITKEEADGYYQPKGTYVKTVNGNSPDTDGNVTIEVQSALTFTSSDSSVTIDTTTKANTVDISKATDARLTQDMIDAIAEITKNTYSYTYEITPSVETIDLPSSATTVDFTAAFSASKTSVAYGTKDVAIDSISVSTSGWTVSGSSATNTATLDKTATNISSGTIVATVTDADSKSGVATGKAVTVKFTKPWFIFNSTETSFTAEAGKTLVESLIDGTATNLKTGRTSVSNSKETTFVMPETGGAYVWFAIPNTLKLVSVEQLSKNVLQTGSDGSILSTTTSDTTLGAYKLYRWALTIISGDTAVNMRID